MGEHADSPIGMMLLLDEFIASRVDRLDSPIGMMWSCSSIFTEARSFTRCCIRSPWNMRANGAPRTVDRKSSQVTPAEPKQSSVMLQA